MQKGTIPALLLLTFTLAATNADALSMSNTAVINVRPDTSYGGGAFVRFSGGTLSGAQSCTSTTGVGATWYWIPSTHVQYKELLVTALTAYSLNKKVVIGGDVTCTSNYENIRYIQLQ